MTNNNNDFINNMKSKIAKKQIVVKHDGFKSFEDKMDYYPQNLSIKGTKVC